MAGNFCKELFIMLLCYIFARHCTNDFDTFCIFSNEPLVLEPINAPFNSTLTFMDLTPDETFDFGVRQGSVRVASPSVSRPSKISRASIISFFVKKYSSLSSRNGPARRSGKIFAAGTPYR